jgi:hypothetical protein
MRSILLLGVLTTLGLVNAQKTQAPNVTQSDTDVATDDDIPPEYQGRPQIQTTFEPSISVVQFKVKAFPNYLTSCHQYLIANQVKRLVEG